MNFTESHFCVREMGGRAGGEGEGRGRNGKGKGRETLLAGRGNKGLVKLLTLILFTIKALPGLIIFESIDISLTFPQKIFNAN